MTWTRLAPAILATWPLGCSLLAPTEAELFGGTTDSPTQSGGHHAGGSGGVASSIGGAGATGAGAGSWAPPVGECGALPLDGKTLTPVLRDSDLGTAVENSVDGAVFVLHGPSYVLKAPLNIAASITIVSAGSDATQATISPAPGLASEIMIRISAPDVTLAHVTLDGGGIPKVLSIQGTRPRLHGVEVRGAGMTGVEVVNDPDAYVDGGSVSCSVFRWTEACPGSDVFGLRVPGGRDWQLRFNRFEAYDCARARAVVFDRGARGTIIENNLFEDCTTSIVLGNVEPSEFSRQYTTDDPYPTIANKEHVDGIVRNNVLHGAGTAGASSGAMQLWHAIRPSVAHNTILLSNADATAFRVMAPGMVRTETVVALINNNLYNGANELNGATVDLSGSFSTATPAAFTDVSLLDFHLSAGEGKLFVDQGAVLVRGEGGLDLDGQPHEVMKPDVGADEVSAD